MHKHIQISIFSIFKLTYLYELAQTRTHSKQEARRTLAVICLAKKSRTNALIRRVIKYFFQLSNFCFSELIERVECYYYFRIIQYIERLLHSKLYPEADLWISYHGNSFFKFSFFITAKPNDFKQFIIIANYFAFEISCKICTG